MSAEGSDTFGSSDDGAGRRSSAARRLFVVLAVLLPVGLIAGLLWLVGGGTERDQTAKSPSPPASSAPSSGDTDTDADPDSATPTEPDASRGTPSGKPSPSAKEPKTLRGKTVVLDPGHNPGNREHPAEINRSVDIGTGRKECDTTGTASNAGYPEATFTLKVARKARTLLEQRGATVKFTQDDDRPYGPCVDERARIGNKAKADAVVSVHADGSTAPGNRGFHVIAPHLVRGGGANTGPIVKDSARLGGYLADNYRRVTGMPTSNYLGADVAASGVTTRDDLGGLNLSEVPKVFLECGNMRDTKDVALLTDERWQGKAAKGIADGITAYLVGNR